MRSFAIVIVAFLILGIAPASRSQTAPADRDLERENARLREEVTRLRKQVLELQGKLSQLERQFRGWRAPSTRPFDFRFNPPKGTIPLPPAPLVPIPPREP